MIVRSSANIQSGAKNKTSTIIHGVLLFLSAFLIPHLINLIPLACLAALMIVVGFKLAKPQLFIKMYRSGPYVFIPFIATVLGLVFTDLLFGITIGFIFAVSSIIIEHYKLAMQFKIVREKEKTIIYLSEHMSFLSKANLAKLLRNQPKSSVLLIDARKSKFIDHDIKEILDDFKKQADIKDISYSIINHI